MIKRLLFTAMTILCVGMPPATFAADRYWSFDTTAQDGLSTLGGKATSAPGVAKKSNALNGVSVLQVEASQSATHSNQGFSCAVWVNPYTASNDQQMIVAKNRYSLNQREWGVMIDRDGHYTLYVWQDGWQTIASDIQPTIGKWQHVAVAISHNAAKLWIDGKSAGTLQLNQPVPKTEARLTFGGVNDHGQIRQTLFGALDEAFLFDHAATETEITKLYDQHQPGAATAPPHHPPRLADTTLWSGGTLPEDPAEIPVAEGVQHQTLHDARTHNYKFLHGAALIHYQGNFFANWANSPKNENQQFETMQGRRSSDGGQTWSDVEVIGAGFEGPERHSHGVFMKHQGRLWTFAARFGKGTEGRRFPGLCTEAFVFNAASNTWDSQGIVMTNCWPYDEPVLMADGNFITGGQDRDGRPVVAISQGNDLTNWDSVSIPYDRRLQPSFAETTVTTVGRQALAVIRGGGGVAWVSTSDDFGRTWSTAVPSNFPMPRAKAYLGRLSTGQLYLISNYKNRDTLVVAVGQPGQDTLSSIWKVRHGKSGPPRFPGAAKSKQWSYPYGYEHDGKLYIVYSIGKEDCGLSVIPISGLQ